MTLAELYRVNRAMPNGGPRLLALEPNEFLDYWTVGDGLRHYEKFPSRRAAHAALRRAGFVSHAMRSEKIVLFHTY